MKGKLVLTIGFAGVLALSIGFTKDFQKTETSVEGKDVTTVITVEEQNIVENSLAQQGFVPQENGTGFFFTKEK